MPMSVPVVAADGHSYERKAISKWVASKATSPMTGAPLVDMTFFPNVNLEKLIQDFVSKKEATVVQKKMKKSDGVPNFASSNSLICNDTLDDSDAEDVRAKKPCKKARKCDYTLVYEARCSRQPARSLATACLAWHGQTRHRRRGHTASV
eukprot:4806297-Prymnesium_polylepis.1